MASKKYNPLVCTHSLKIMSLWYEIYDKPKYARQWSLLSCSINRVGKKHKMVSFERISWRNGQICSSQQKWIQLPLTEEQMRPLKPKDPKDDHDHRSGSKDWWPVLSLFLCYFIFKWTSPAHETNFINPLHHLSISRIYHNISVDAVALSDHIYRLYLFIRQIMFSRRQRCSWSCRATKRSVGAKYY